jgi:hypothetical protein
VLASQRNATAIDDLTPLRFDLPAVRRKKLTVDFDGGNQSSDAGVLLLRAAEQKIGVIGRMSAPLPDRRDATRIRHRFAEIIGARVFGICEGYEDAIDHDRLRHDPALKMAVGRCPESGAPLASQSTISRFENAPTKTDAARLACALVDQFATHVTPSHRDIFDIDDTFDAAYGGQQLTFWNAHHDERGFAPMHVYHAGSGLPVATILRPAKTPSGIEVRCVIKHLTTRIRKTWSQSAPGKKPNIVWRGDSHYGRAEAMDWCDANGVGYIFGFPAPATAQDRRPRRRTREPHPRASPGQLQREGPVPLDRPSLVSIDRIAVGANAPRSRRARQINPQRVPNSSCRQRSSRPNDGPRPSDQAAWRCWWVESRMGAVAWAVKPSLRFPSPGHRE